MSVKSVESPFNITLIMLLTVGVRLNKTSERKTHTHIPPFKNS